MSKHRTNPQQDRVEAFLLECLTSPGNGLEADDLAHYRLVAEWYGVTRELGQFLAVDAERPQMKRELCLAIAVEALNRLLA